MHRPSFPTAPAGRIAAPPTRGWHLLGFAGDLAGDQAGDLAEAMLGDRPLLLVRGPEGLRIFDGTCPHRGARLAQGGRLRGERVVCPFHGHAIGLGGEGPLCLREYPAMEIGELVFVLWGDGPGCGFAEDLAALRRDHVFVHGFAMKLPVPPALVIENAFDVAHFGPVHGVGGADPLDVTPWTPEAGAPLTARGRFHVGASRWDPEPEGTPVSIAYEARAYAPGLILSAQAGRQPFRFLVGACPDPDGGSTARVVLLLPRDGGPPDMERVEWLIAAMEAQLDADRRVWEGMPPDPPRMILPGEEAIAAFDAFCGAFSGARA